MKKAVRVTGKSRLAGKAVAVIHKIQGFQIADKTNIVISVLECFKSIFMSKDYRKTNDSVVSICKRYE